MSIERDRRRKPKVKRKVKPFYAGDYVKYQENDFIGWGVRRRNVARLERIRNQE